MKGIHNFLTIDFAFQAAMEYLQTFTVFFTEASLNKY